MTIESIKCIGTVSGSTDLSTGFVVYDGTKAYIVPECSTVAFNGGVLTCTPSATIGDPAIQEIDVTAGVAFHDFSSNLETKTVQSGATAQVVYHSETKVGMSAVNVSAVEDGHVYGGFTVGDYAYIVAPYKYRACIKKAPEYQITSDNVVYDCYKAQMKDVGHDMGAQIIFKDGTLGLIIPMFDVVGKFFAQKIV